MKLQVNVPRRWAYAVLIALLFGSGLFAVWAYNANYGTAGKPVGDVAKVGHSPDEIEVDLGGVGTGTCEGKRTLQYAIVNKCLGGTGTQTGGGGTIGWVNFHSGGIQGGGAGSQYISWNDNADHSPTKMCQDAGFDDYTGACKFTYNGNLAEGSVASNSHVIGANKWSVSCLYGSAFYADTTTTQLECIKGGANAVSKLGSPSCTARGGIATGTFAADTGYVVQFSPEFATGVKPIVLITPDITGNSISGTTALSVIVSVSNAGFIFQSQAPLTYMHYVAYDPACFPPIGVTSGNSNVCSGVTDGATCSDEWDCCSNSGGAYHCRSGKWKKLTGTQCV